MDRSARDALGPRAGRRRRRRPAAPRARAAARGRPAARRPPGRRSCAPASSSAWRAPPRRGRHARRPGRLRAGPAHRGHRPRPRRRLGPAAGRGPPARRSGAAPRARLPVRGAPVPSPPGSRASWTRPTDNGIVRAARTRPAARRPGGRRRRRRARAATARGCCARATCVGWPDELRLGDDLSGLRAADDLRARALAAVLRVHLREAFGRALVHRRRAPASSCASSGSRPATSTPRGSPCELGAAGLDPGLIVAEALEGLD